MKIAVLMTCHNRCQKTNNCLRHLYNNKEVENLSFDVFLVDDGCTDGTPVVIQQSYPDVKIVKGDGTLFWNRGMSLAWEFARQTKDYEGYLWLNDDTNIKENALDVIHRFYNQYADCILVGTTCSTTDEAIITYGGIRNGKVVTPSDENIHCDAFNGNFVFVPKVVSDKIGYLDPYYKHAYGDYDYAMTAKRNGITSVVLPVIGTCDRNNPEPKWNKGNIVERFKKLYSPLGNNPFDTFHYYRKESFGKAVMMFVYIHLRVLITPIIPKK